MVDFYSLPYEQRFYGKIVALEVDGEARFSCEHEFQELKRVIESDNRPNGTQYSVRKCVDKPYHCETFIVR